MKRFRTYNRVFFGYRALILLPVFGAFLLAGCQTTPVTPTNTTTANATNTANANTTVANSIAPASTATAVDFPVTMPVIDAMFSDESFAEAARNSAHLTDEEIGK